MIAKGAAQRRFRHETQPDFVLDKNDRPLAGRDGRDQAVRFALHVPLIQHHVREPQGQAINQQRAAFPTFKIEHAGDIERFFDRFPFAAAPDGGLCAPSFPHPWRGRSRHRSSQARNFPPSFPHGGSCLTVLHREFSVFRFIRAASTPYLAFLAVRPIGIGRAAIVPWRARATGKQKFHRKNAPALDRGEAQRPGKAQPRPTEPAMPLDRRQTLRRFHAGSTRARRRPHEDSGKTTGIIKPLLNRPPDGIFAGFHRVSAGFLARGSSHLPRLPRFPGFDRLRCA